MDNEVSEDLKQYFETSDIQFQLVPPYMRWRNAAEIYTITFKKHFIAALCTVYPRFPFYLWDLILPQVDLKLNILRWSWLKPEISAYEQVDDIHNFERTPLAPLVCKVKIHDKPRKRLTYVPHLVDGWYLWTEVRNYRCYTWYNIDTGG